MTAQVLSFRRSRRCRPPFDRALCSVLGCGFNDPDGSLAREGRTRLHAELVDVPDDPGGCDRPGCTKCGAQPFTPEEADGVLDHLTDREAVLYALGFLGLDSFGWCDDCDRWLPSLRPKQDALDLAECPFHPTRNEEPR